MHHATSSACSLLRRPKGRPAAPKGLLTHPIPTFHIIIISIPTFRIIIIITQVYRCVGGPCAGRGACGGWRSTWRERERERERREREREREREKRERESLALGGGLAADGGPLVQAAREPLEPLPHQPDLPRLVQQNGQIKGSKIAGSKRGRAGPKSRRGRGAQRGRSRGSVRIFGPGQKSVSNRSKIGRNRSNRHAARAAG
jgi:hypothetical protein